MRMRCLTLPSLKSIFGQIHHENNIIVLQLILMKTEM